MEWLWNLLQRLLNPNNLGSGMGLINLTNDLMNMMRNTVNAYRGIDAAAASMVRELGGGVNAIREISRATLSAVHDLELARKYNITSEELIRAQSSFAQAIGRNVQFSAGRRDENGRIIEGTSQKDTMAAMMRAFGEQTTTDMLQNLELYGLGIDDVSKRMTTMFKTATKSGISFKNYTDAVVKNMKLAQNFTFKNGLKGLESMAKKAVELRMDMAQIEAFANKVNTLEGAVTTSAKLQVLGGPFAQIADPLAMLSEGLTDIEALQDRAIRMVGELGNFDKRTGEINLSAFDKQRLRVAAEAVGMSYNDLYQGAQSKARQNEVERQVRDSVGEGAFNKDFLELLKNTAQFRNGQAIFSDGDKEYTMQELAGNQDLQRDLMSRFQDERKDVKDIALSVMSINDKFDAIYKQMITGKAYAESEARYKEGGYTNLENVGRVLSNYNIDYNELGAAMNVFSHAFGAVMEDLTMAGLPELQKLPDFMDSILDKFKEIFSLGDFFNWSGTGNAPGDSEGWRGGAQWLADWWNNGPGKWINEKLGIDTTTKSTATAGSTTSSTTSGVSAPPVPEAALGGSVFGPSHAKGGVPIIAEGGEFVVNQKTMDNYGPLIEALNTQGAKQYHLGGYVSKISATATNGIQTYRVSGREETQKSRQTEELEPKDINVNIKLSDLFVRGDGTGKIDMQSLVNDSAFVNKIKEMILASLDNKSDIAEKKI